MGIINIVPTKVRVPIITTSVMLDVYSRMSIIFKTEEIYSSTIPCRAYIAKVYLP